MDIRSPNIPVPCYPMEWMDFILSLIVKNKKMRGPRVFQDVLINIFLAIYPRSFVVESPTLVFF